MYLGGNCRWLPLTTAPSKAYPSSPWQISAIKWTVLALIKGAKIRTAFYSPNDPIFRAKTGSI